MAISQMKKLSVISPKGSTRKLIRRLQKLSCVEFAKAPNLNISDGADTQKEKSPPALLAKISAIEEKLTVAKRAVTFLTAYTEARELISDVPDINMEDFDCGLDIISYEEAEKALVLQDKINKRKAYVSELEAEIAALAPWEPFATELPEHKTKHTLFLAGSFPANTELAALEDKLSSLACQLSVTEEDKYSKTAFIFCHNEDYAEVRRAISTLGFTPTTARVTQEEGFAKEKLALLRSKLDTVKAELVQLKKDSVEHSKKLVDIKALCDVYETRIERLQARCLATETARTTVISGWVPVSSIKAVEEVLNEYGCAYSFDDPTEEDDVPVLLRNNAFATNFQPVLTMYSLPAYGSFDPTMIMSIFYIIIFGLMFADVGYGITVLIGCLAMLKFMKPGEGMRRMLTMFAICSLSCIFFGAMFGGYFGDLPVAIRKNFLGHENAGSPALLFDMLENPLLFFVISLVTGVLHIVCAMLVKFYILVRDKQVFAAFADIGSWLLVFAGIGVYFVNSKVGLIVALCGVAALILTQGRHEKNPIMKLIKGVMSLYDIVNYGADVLSYSRILALSLSSAIIASVFNTIATLGGFTIPGVVLFIIVFLFGHALNMAVNLLGTYVHTNRLQYLEFFGKFFEGGGREFSPLKYKSNYVNLK